MFGSKKKEEMEKKRKSDQKWCCWNSAMFGRTTWLYEDTRVHPENYKDGAAEEFARMAMGYFEELYGLDPENALMVANSFIFDIGCMIEALGDEGKKYYRMLV